MTLTGNHFESGRRRAVRWTAAAVFMVGVHIGFAAIALMHRAEDDSDDVAAGPIAVELAQMPVLARQDSPDVAHGPLMMETPPGAEPAKATQVEVEKEIPPVEQSPLASDPEVVVPVPKPVVETKPEEEQPRDNVAREESADPAEPMPQTTAPPRVDAQETQASPAPNLGPTIAVVRNPAWEKALASHLNRHKRYPDGARARSIQGSVTVIFTIDRDGYVLEARVAESSGSPVLDEEALAVLRRASPVPTPPPAVGLSLKLPIQFHIR
jgi:periplasmic protein TonB